MSLSDARPTREKSQPSAWAPPSNAPSRRGVNVADAMIPSETTTTQPRSGDATEEPGRPVTDEIADHDRDGEAGQEPGNPGQGRDSQHVVIATHGTGNPFIEVGPKIVAAGHRHDPGVAAVFRGEHSSAMAGSRATTRWSLA